ncbi:MAG: Rpp14/Pop5 family protein [Halodesulfurarchaeum sp.]
MRHLPKHLRPRYRYLAVEIEAPLGDPLEEPTFRETVARQSRSLLGDVGSAATDLRAVEIDLGDGGGTGLFRVRHDAVDRGRAVLACVSSVEGTPVRVGVRGVSGTIRAAREHLDVSLQGGERESARFRNRDVEVQRRGDRIDLVGEDVAGTTADIE